MAGNIQANDAASLSFGNESSRSESAFTAYGGNLSAPLARDDDEYPGGQRVSLL